MFARLTSLSGAVVWGLITFAAPVLAESLGEEPVSRDHPSLLTCGVARCSEDWVCANQCPQAESAVCVNFYCQFTYPDEGGGGGGGGGGGPTCGVSRCSEDWQCVCDGVQGVCGSNFLCAW
ncbi:hypothetical protein LZ198_14240 [Myxococcus sp. K15C18031901]|uniref:hypothetical protein n=1 Tax=Myxococcus dinghuensis TaxID=2906761 RepID=UPI0020A82217|nr:hypothetical protein [Myxococcus dinghuensis]MCP3100032.1 hypothetical protein [Myxococcus dinghuensis]